MKTLYKTLAAFVLSMACATAGYAYVAAPGQADVPVILVPHNPQLNYQERTLCYNIEANIPYTVSCEAEWVKVIQRGSAVYVHVDQNYYDTERTASILFTNDEVGMKQVMTVTQTRDESVEEAPSDIRLVPKSATASSFQSGEGIERSYDDDTSTLYHSSYAGGVSASAPVTLTYNFNATTIDFINYIPRQDSSTNGCFGEVELLIKHDGDKDFTSFGKFDWEKRNETRSVVLSDEVKDNITAVRFVVSSGGGTFASCAEMQFMQLNKEGLNEYAIFGDELYSTLRADVTKDDIDALENPFIKALANQLFAGTYNTDYRVADYQCYTPVTTLSDLWNAPGKYYDQRAGVTGINITKGKQAVVVSGIPENYSVQLVCTAWYEGHDGGNFDGGNPVHYTYLLRNGLNIIRYTFDYDALAYICYYADNAESMPDIKVHFINGQVNGYLSPEKTNKEMQTLCKNAKNICMDVLGKKVHSVWTAQGLSKYCLASDGKSLGYRQFMNVLDSLVQWEHRHLGLEKYNRIPRNRTMAYTNYTYYMFQGGLGVSFHHDQEQRVLNCKTLMYNDDDAIWGLSHEWGHQHQMQPYFCWSGMGEVSNNIFSYYNTQHMGYKYTRGSWNRVRELFYENKAVTSADGYAVSFKNGKPYSQRRSDMYKFVSGSSSAYNYSAKLRAHAMAEKDSLIYDYSENPGRSLSYFEAGAGDMLAPIILIDNYASLYLEKDGKKYNDFYPDILEALRQNEQLPGGSTVEKQDGFDKYELVSAAQNGNKDGLYTKLKELFPESIWAKETGGYNYLNKGNVSWYDNSVPAVMNYVRKASRLYGYNLLPVFDRWGWFRTGAYYIGDYGNKKYVLTQEMLDEFTADMKALEDNGTIKPITEEMVHDIMYCRHFNESNTDRLLPTPNIPN